MSLVPVTDIAAQLGRDGRTIRRWITLGHITGERMGSHGQWHADLNEALAFARANTPAPEPTEEGPYTVAILDLNSGLTLRQMQAFMDALRLLRPVARVWTIDPNNEDDTGSVARLRREAGDDLL